jgi:hypothetical protein
LKDIKEDYTHNQEASIETITKWYKEGKSFYSLDLKRATDRLPLGFQAGVLLLIGLNEKCVTA